MANFKNIFKSLKPAGISQSGMRVSKLVTAKSMKPMTLTKIKVIKDKIEKPINFSKFTKMPKMPKVAKIKLIKKVIKLKKNVGF